jgi:diacylglycerol O-acyltransferase / wax synthase
MERMSTLDAGFYLVEHENVPMHIGSVVVFEGPAPPYKKVVKLYAGKIPLVPRYRKVVRTTPLQLFGPYWADDERFDIGYHVRRATVPEPGGPGELSALAAEIFANPLDRSRPLWEAWLLDGIAGGGWAILSKVHHCMVDGVGGTELLTTLFELGPDTRRPPPPVRWEPEPRPSVLSQVAGGLRDGVTWPLRQVATVPGLVMQRLRIPADLPSFGRGLTGSARRLTEPSASSLNGPVGPERRWTWTTASYSEVKQIRQGLGGTVNDVLLAVITRGFRDLLEARGELTDGLVVRSLVPVSVRGKDEHGMITNRISAVLANLPVSEPDPVRRLRLLQHQMSDLKRTHQAVGAEFLTEVLGMAAPTLLALGLRAALRLRQPLVQTVTTNVPGPPFPLYVLGRKMTGSYPYVPIANNIRIGLAIFSYLGSFAFGVTADPKSVPDLDVLINGIGHGMAELSKAAAERSRADRDSSQSLHDYVPWAYGVSGARAALGGAGDRWFGGDAWVRSEGLTVPASASRSCSARAACSAQRG